MPPVPNNPDPRTSLSDTRDYLAICQRAAKNEATFKTFKRNKNYRQILEHLKKREGQAYLNVIKEEGPYLLKYFPKFRKNDRLGCPVTYNYGVGRFSPTTFRYIKVLMDLVNLFGDLNRWDIVEIGGGYGGQCKIIADVFKPRSYTIVDLERVLPLTQKYLERLNVKKVGYLTQQQLNGEQEYDLIISNYAFAECIKSVQDDYIKKILNHARRGYITYNDESASSLLPLYNKKEIIRILAKSHPPHVLAERPPTGGHNFLMVWDDTKKPHRFSRSDNKNRRS